MSLNRHASSSSSSSPRVVERRAWVRYACDLATSCQPITAQRDAGWAARVQNVSRGGLCLVGTRRFEAGTLLHIEFEQAQEPAPASVLTRVVHVRRTDSVLWMMGCAFPKPLTEEELQALLKSAPTTDDD